MTYRLERVLLMKAITLKPVSYFGVFLAIRYKFRLLEIAEASDNIHPMRRRLFTIYLQPINN
jgi:hypothetical protein